VPLSKESKPPVPYSTIVKTACVADQISSPWGFHLMSQSRKVTEAIFEAPRTNTDIARRRPRIAILDYIVTSTTPIGSCHLALLDELCEEFDFTVFTAKFENPRPDRIRFVRVPLPARPLFLIYLVYHLAVLPVFLWNRWIKGLRFDVVQSAETYSLIADVRYSQFCHTSYLREHWKETRSQGIRKLFRWLDHVVRSFGEDRIYQRTEKIVVPSYGLARELRAAFSLSDEKVVVIGNPVDLEKFDRPSDFDAVDFRNKVGISADDVVAVFVALGHFERKGLPFIFSAMKERQDPNFKLLIVGGRSDLIAEYRRIADKMGIGANVVFVGMQQDVRPWLWSSDVFLFPSTYETFSLVTFQAAAAGLPIIAGRIHGVEELLEDGVNGLCIECTDRGVEQGITRFLSLGANERLRMGQAARISTSAFGKKNFGRKWAEFYRALFAHA
jgi:glycosyltransferase involved in cell wall biosynthesis